MISTKTVEIRGLVGRKIRHKEAPTSFETRAAFTRVTYIDPIVFGTTPSTILQ